MRYQSTVLCCCEARHCRPRASAAARARRLLLLAAGLGLAGARLRDEGGAALAAVDAVKVGGHEGAGAAVGALPAQALHLAGVVHLQGDNDAAVLRGTQELSAIVG